MPQQCYKWGTAQQCNKPGNTAGMFQDCELFSNVNRQGLHQQCFKVRTSSAM